VKRLLRLAALLFFCVLTLVVRCHNLRDVFLDGRIHFVDPDCYSRMTRARMVAEHPGTVVRHHDFENFPQGVKSHTTAPLDYLIVAGKKVLDFGFWISNSGSVLRGQTLDLAGALVGPVLGLLGAVFLAVWAWALRVRFWGMALLLYAVSPILVHGTVLGRPDHQALLIVLLMGAVGAEMALVKMGAELSKGGHPERSVAESKDLSRPAGGGGGEGDTLSPTASTHEKLEVVASPPPPPRLSRKASARPRSAHLSASASLRMTAWGIVAGVAWALSLWVSLYEPGILLGMVLGLWLALDRRALCSRERRVGWMAFAVILAVAFLLEGWRIEAPDAAMREYFGRWKESIGELAHLDLRSAVLFRWLGWLALAAPGLLILQRKAERGALPALALLVALVGLTVWQVRWGYFLAAVFVLALPVFMPALRKTWVAWLLFVIALWPVAQDWDARLFPDAEAQRDLAVRRAEAVALRSIVAGKTGANGGPFLAPWWLSPPIAYWTGQPGVAGSSHQSLPGIVDTARFYLSANGDEAVAILRARGVRWILADDPEREISTGAALLAVTPPAVTMAALLAPRGAQRNAQPPGDEWPAAPTARVIYGSVFPPMELENSFFKIWRVRPEAEAANVPAP